MMFDREVISSALKTVVSEVIQSSDISITAVSILADELKDTLERIMSYESNYTGEEEEEEEEDKPSIPIYKFEFLHALGRLSLQAVDWDYNLDINELLMELITHCDTTFMRSLVMSFAKQQLVVDHLEDTNMTILEWIKSFAEDNDCVLMQKYADSDQFAVFKTEDAADQLSTWRNIIL